MALFYKVEDLKGGGNKAVSLARARSVVSRELKIAPLHVSFDPDGEYIRVDFATPKPRRRNRPSRRRQSQKASPVKIFGIEFKPR
ncbi:MAG: hypothetical protein V2A77_12015 [Pseudomonadota bacterium]